MIRVSGQAYAAIAETQAAAAAAAASAVDASASAAAAATSATAAQTAADNAVVGYLSFATVADMEAFVSADDHQTASVLEDENYYYWDDGGGAWVLIGPNPSAQIATIGATYATAMPVSANDGTITLMTQDGWVIATLTPANIRTLSQQADWLNSIPSYIKYLPSNGHLRALTSDGWVITDYDAPAAAASAVEESDTVGHVADALSDQTGDQPLLVGQNIFLTVGESKANSINFKANAFDQICTQMGTPKPASATVADADYFHNAFTVDEVIADWAAVKTIIDSAFSGGAECISMLSFVEMANDMGAGGTYTAVDDWETSILQLQAMVQRYSMQKYVGTTAAAIMPVPPVFMSMDCTWAKGPSAGVALPLDIPLRAVEMARRIWNFGIAVPDYIDTFYDDRHFGKPGDISDTATITLERNRISAYFGLADYWWRILKRKYNPTQVVDSWFDGTDAFLRVQMPHGPLVADTALVSTIANNGLQAFTAAGAAITISALSIVGGGQVIKISQASAWAVGDKIWGGITGTTADKSGRIDGPRLMYRDSSPYQVDLGAGLVHLYSPMLPFKLTLA